MHDDSDYPVLIDSYLQRIRDISPTAANQILIANYRFRMEKGAVEVVNLHLGIFVFHSHPTFSITRRPKGFTHLAQSDRLSTMADAFEP
jgi:hypothetical protein